MKCVKNHYKKKDNRWGGKAYIIQSMHTALYCICVCSLSSTNPLAPEAKHYIDSTDDLKNNGKAQ